VLLLVWNSDHLQATPLNQVEAASAHIKGSKGKRKKPLMIIVFERSRTARFNVLTV